MMEMSIPGISLIKIIMMSNKAYSFIALLATITVSCSIHELDQKDESAKVFYAQIEAPAGSEQTKVYADEDLSVLWHADDRVSIFDKNTYNQEYRFTGKTGANAGAFEKVANSGFVTGNALSSVYSVYPYKESTEISNQGVISVDLPATQSYSQNSFGLEANTMVSVSSDNLLMFKNVGGYLRLSLYGDGVSVSSITLKGNNGEKLAGKATVTMPQDGTPTVTMAQDAAEEITLICDSPVALGATAEESVDFWYVVPPVIFSKGFTVSVNHTGGVFEKVSSKSIAIARNHLTKMSPVEIEYSQPNNVIYYTSSDETVITPYDPYVFGSNIISNEYVDGQGIITFDGDVTQVGDYAFQQEPLISVSLPKSVTSIGVGAFYWCLNLVSVNLPEGMKSIEEQAFFGCYSLASISIPKSVVSIGKYAFAQCGSLIDITVDPQNLVYDSRDNCNAIIETSTNTLIRGSSYSFIPDDVRELGAFAFSRCSELSSIIIPESVQRIGSGAFSRTGLTSIRIPEGITSIGSSTFSFCENLISVSIPESVSIIGDSAFQDCTSLPSISIPHNVKSIGKRAFSNCTSLASISVPGCVDFIDEYAFFGCTGLTSVSIEMGVKSIGYAAFWDCSGLISIELPNSLTSIGDGAFVNCSSLDSITIPASVTSMGLLAFGWCTGLSSLSLSDGLSCIGEASFYSCSRLSTITIPDSVTSIGESAFEECTNLANIIILSNLPPSGSQYMFDNTNNCPILVPAESVETYKTAQYWSEYADRIRAISQSNNVLYYTSSDGKVVSPYNTSAFGANIISNEYVDGRGILTFDSGIKSIGDKAFFRCYNLATIVIPEGVTSIGDSAFYLSGLTSINIPNSIMTIGDNAFYHCYLKSFNGKFASPDGLFLIDSGTLLAAAFDSISEHLIIPDGVTCIGPSAFSGCSKLRDIIFPEGLTIIGVSAFSYCEFLTRLTLPDGLTSIGSDAFSYCSELTSIRIPQSLTSIGSKAFYQCYDLSSIAFPDGLTSIGDYAFYQCSSLVSITIPQGITSIGNSVFRDCLNLTSIILPSGLKRIGDFAFSWCYSLSSIDIPGSVTDISMYAFQYCKGLTRITLPSGLTSIEWGVFEDCAGLTSIDIPENVTSIKGSALNGCSSLSYIKVKPGTPPVGDGSMFYNTNNCPIYVPIGSMDAYKSAEYWCDYADRIEAISQ